MISIDISSIKKFGEFKLKDGRKMLDGEKIKIDKILDKEIVVLDYVIFDSIQERGGKCLKVLFKFTNDDRDYIFNTSSKVLMKQINDESVELPFIGVIYRKGKYFCLK